MATGTRRRALIVVEQSAAIDGLGYLLSERGTRQDGVARVESKLVPRANSALIKI